MKKLNFSCDPARCLKLVIWPTDKKCCTPLLYINFNCTLPIGKRYLISYPVVIDQELSCDIEMIFVQNI